MKELLGLSEISVGGLGQTFAFERHHPLIALALRAAVDGHGEMTLAKQMRQVPIAAHGRDAFSREARIAAQLPRHLIIGDEQVDGTVGRGL